MSVSNFAQVPGAEKILTTATIHREADDDSKDVGRQMKEMETKQRKMDEKMDIQKGNEEESLSGALEGAESTTTLTAKDITDEEAIQAAPLRDETSTDSDSSSDYEDTSSSSSSSGMADDDQEYYDPFKKIYKKRRGRSADRSSRASDYIEGDSTSEDEDFVLDTQNDERHATGVLGFLPSKCGIQ